MKPELIALEGKLVEVKAGDRDLDALIATTLLPREYLPAVKPFRPGLVGVRPPDSLNLDNGCGYISECDAKHYTSSIDAALALVSRVKPGYAIDDMMIWPGCPVRLRLVPTEYKTQHFANKTEPVTAYWSAGYGWEAEAATAGLAICLALIRSLKGAVE